MFAFARWLILYFGLNVRWLWRKGSNFGGKFDQSLRPRSGRKWRIAVNKCKSYQEYSKIPIDEPKLDEPDEHPLTAMTAIRVSHQQFMANIKYVEKALKRQAMKGLRSLNLISKKNIERRNSLRRSSSDGNKSETNLSNMKGLNRKASITSASLRHSNSLGNMRRNHLQAQAAENLLGITGNMITTTTERLKEARENDDYQALQYLLTGVVKRNHLSIDDIMNENSRNIANSGRSQLPAAAMDIIVDYIEEVIQCLEWMADPETIESDLEDEMDEDATMKDVAWTREEGRLRDTQKVLHRLRIMKKLKQNTGRTALMLSGGGAITMYHLGVVRALVESGVYEHIPVVSGTSGGSISAAMCAAKTPQELLSEVCVSSISTDYPAGSGIMKKNDIRWFPRVVDMMTHWLKTKYLVDHREFKRTCDHYWGDMTFEEAFQRTGKHVCIHVSASRAGGGGGAQKLLLNHISTPHVTLASAVNASCSLPGIMKPATLFMKNSAGKIEPFAVDGVEWIDGSVQADLPFRRISTLFNISNFIVSQVNFHVVPLMNKAHHPSVHTYYWKLFQLFEWDIRSRALNLSRLGLFPKIFGQDISSVFKQKYHGNITIVPRFTKMSMIGANAVLNPTLSDMEVYLQNGQVATWPYIEAIKHNLRIEEALECCIASIEQYIGDVSIRAVGSLDSMTKSDRDVFKSLKAVDRLQSENNMLKRRIKELEAKMNALGIDYAPMRKSERGIEIEKEFDHGKDSKSFNQPQTCTLS
eukprot:CAMPEP_0116060516 /NCGR_PEP_ID=MMETSP0322-20121206/6467_1 /TAXON_ID=163516 /ORGANISM="Leptocylindrus danicus var. apora, Strain B651" /LENGTH=755 /DNA_ID=CAMNT_0003545161 /DNA_START=404 /DNA_END=2671 /DNA_ORIENTATION=+